VADVPPPSTIDRVDPTSERATTPARHDLRRRLPELALESAMIVLSVLLAMAASSWADARKQDRLTEQARQSFVQEIRANRARLVRALPYHRRLTDAVRLIDSTTGVDSYGEWRRRVPFWSGFEGPDLTATAWQSALATGALANMPYREVSSLSSLYTIQGKLDAYNMASVPLFDFSDVAMHGTVRRVNAYMQTVMSYETALARQCDSTLAVLDRPAARR
jgi:type II secretory pathway pseudopilin PulG